MTDPTPHFRALARRPVSLPARIERAPQPASGSGKLIDLGLGGACVELGQPPEDGTSIDLLIDAPHLWDPLRLEARVAWVRPAQGKVPARVGVHFRGATGTTLRLLAELLEADAYGA